MQHFVFFAYWNPHWLRGPDPSTGEGLKNATKQYKLIRELGVYWYVQFAMLTLHIVYSLHILYIVHKLYIRCVAHTGISRYTSKVFASCTSRTTSIKGTAQLLSSSTWQHQLLPPKCVPGQIEHKLHFLHNLHILHNMYMYRKDSLLNTFCSALCQFSGMHWTLYPRNYENCNCLQYPA